MRHTQQNDIFTLNNKTYRNNKIFLVKFKLKNYFKNQNVI